MWLARTTGCRCRLRQATACACGWPLEQAGNRSADLFKTRRGGGEGWQGAGGSGYSRIRCTGRSCITSTLAGAARLGRQSRSLPTGANRSGLAVFVLFCGGQRDVILIRSGWRRGEEKRSVKWWCADGWLVCTGLEANGKRLNVCKS